MLVFECVKMSLLKHITMWQSHAITIGFSSVMATGAACVILLRYGSLSRQLEQKIEAHRQTAVSLHRLMTGAHCLLWHAEVRDTPSGYEWHIDVPDKEAALRWLPIEIEEGQQYTSAWHVSKLPEDRALMDEVSCHALRSGHTKYTQEFRCRLADGSLRWLYEDVQVNHIEPGRWSLVGVCTDITDRKHAEDQLAYQALHDALTGLPNRLLFMDRLKGALMRSQRLETATAVIFVDLDNFKVVNDSLGHEAGDTLLRTIAMRLRCCIRPEDTLARLGGDEFTILLESIPDIAEAILVAEHILEQLQAPIDLADRQVFAGASLGIALSTKAASDPEGLLRDADTAMYQAKMAGKSGYALFDSSMSARAMERLELEHDLRQALDAKEFELLYQPIVDLATHRVSEVEALLRWEHPTRGTISPVRFIPLAEETGLIIPIGAWVLERACVQAVQWQQEHSAQPLVISVNVSAKQLQHPEFVDTVRDVLKQTGLEPKLLKLEITESLMMLNFDATVQRLHQLKSLGVRLAVDDFGTGYSSMAYLSNLPIDTLKIDRSFVQRLGQTAENEAVVQAIINLAKTLRLAVTSEGIETPDQLEHLQGMGADLGQGYYFAKPLSRRAFGEMLAMNEQPSSKIKADRNRAWGGNELKAA